MPPTPCPAAGDPAAAKVREARDLELSLIDAAKLTVVVSPDEIDIITHYRPDTKVSGSKGW